MINKTKVLERFCKEYWLIENYELALNDKENRWDCHHRREVQDGFRIWTREELIKVGQYYDRPANELIFLKQSEHMALHSRAIDPKTKKPCCLKGSRDIRGDKNPMYSEEARKKMSIAHKGRKHNEEARKKMSIAHKGENLSEETRKKMSIAKKGKAPWNKGVTGAEFTKHYKDGVKNQYIKKSAQEE